MYNNRTGWYKPVNPEKFILPLDEHMQSYKNGLLNYKSSLELKSIRYCDFNKHVVKYSLEPYPIFYIKPTDGKKHRYYVDLYIEFSSGDRFIVEVKSYTETKPPRKPKKLTQKAQNNYKRALQTYSVNQAKWKAATEFAEKNNLRFTIITERELT